MSKSLDIFSATLGVADKCGKQHNTPTPGGDPHHLALAATGVPSNRSSIAVLLQKRTRSLGQPRPRFVACGFSSSFLPLLPRLLEKF
jgi:hypothetical protein